MSQTKCIIDNYDNSFLWWNWCIEVKFLDGLKHHTKLKEVIEFPLIAWKKVTKIFVCEVFIA